MIDILENSDLKPREKEIEKDKVAESRKEFFKSLYMYYLPGSEVKFSLASGPSNKLPTPFTMYLCVKE